MIRQAQGGLRVVFFDGFDGGVCIGRLSGKTLGQFVFCGRTDGPVALRQNVGLIEPPSGALDRPIGFRLRRDGQRGADALVELHLDRIERVAGHGLFGRGRECPADEDQDGKTAHEERRRAK